jgi:Mrp family chromosome partitioning ATPase
VEVDIDKTDPHLVTINDPTSFEAEQYQMLYQRLNQLRRQKGVAVIAVSSPSVGDGKTTTAINLAVAWATTGIRVLLVDADLRRPALANRLGLNGAKTEGLTVCKTLIFPLNRLSLRALD